MYGTKHSTTERDLENWALNQLAYIIRINELKEQRALH